MFNNNFIVVVKVNNKILREDKNTVYVPFGEEYALHFKNLNSKKALVSVEIDGEDVLNGNRIIVDGNSSSKLERFLDNLDEGNKFKFINKTSKIQEYRGDKIDDGIIRITVQYEKQAKTIVPNTTITFRGFKKQVDVCYSSLQPQCFSDSPLEDEGITVKGTLSNQKFSYGNINELEIEKHVFTFQLKGIKNEQTVIEPITVKTKFKCNICGTLNKSNSKFCRECGTYL